MVGTLEVVLGAEDVVVLISCGVDVVGKREVVFGVEVVGRCEVKYGVDVVGRLEVKEVLEAKEEVGILMFSWYFCSSLWSQKKKWEF